MSAYLRREIVQAARRVARLGAGHSERVYHKAMSRELALRSIDHATELCAPVTYDGERIASARRSRRPRAPGVVRGRAQGDPR